MGFTFSSVMIRGLNVSHASLPRALAKKSGTIHSRCSKVWEVDYSIHHLYVEVVSVQPTWLTLDVSVHVCQLLKKMKDIVVVNFKPMESKAWGSLLKGTQWFFLFLVVSVMTYHCLSKQRWWDCPLHQWCSTKEEHSQWTIELLKKYRRKAIETSMKLAALLISRCA